MTSLLLGASHGTPTFITEAPHLISNVQLIIWLYCEMNGKYQYLAFLWQSVTTRFVTKPMPINSIDSKCHTEKLKGSRTCLIDYSDFISSKLFLIAQGQTHTYIQTHKPPIPTSWTKAMSRKQVRAWFKN